MPSPTTTPINFPYDDTAWEDFTKWAEGEKLELDPQEKDWWVPWFKCYRAGWDAGRAAGGV